MNRNRMIWVARHEGVLREISRGVSYGDPECVEQAARILSAFIPSGSTIVPMPSHIGYATTMLTLCRAVKAKCSRVRICDALRCTPHESSHIVKLRHGVAPHTEMRKVKPVAEKPIIIDNVIASGATANAALNAIPDATVLAITKD